MPQGMGHSDEDREKAPVDRWEEVMKGISKGESCRFASPLDRQERVKSGRLALGRRAPRRRADPLTGAPAGQYADIETKLPSFVAPAPGDPPSLTTP
jgi:hypothetical protein